MDLPEMLVALVLSPEWMAFVYAAVAGRDCAPEFILVLSLVD